MILPMSKVSLLLAIFSPFSLCGDSPLEVPAPQVPAPPSPESSSTTDKDAPSKPDVFFGPDGDDFIQGHQPDDLFFHAECTTISHMDQAYWIVVAAKFDFGHPQSNGNLVLLGVDAMISKVNKERTNLNLKPICPIAVNDGYEATVAEKLANYIIGNYKDNVIGYLLPVGTPTTLQIGHTVTSNKRFIFFPYTGAVDFTAGNDEVDLGYVINSRPRYDDEALAILKFMLDRKDVAKIIVMRQDDSFGEAVDTPLTKFTARSNPLFREGLTLYTRNEFDDDQISSTVREADDFLYKARERDEETALVMVGVSTAIAKVIAKVNRDLVQSTVFITISFAGHESLQAELEIELEALDEEDAEMRKRHSFIVEVLPTDDTEWEKVIDEFLGIYGADYPVDFNEKLRYSRATFEALFGANIALNLIHDITLSKGDELSTDQLSKEIHRSFLTGDVVGAEGLYGVHLSEFFGVGEDGNFCNTITNELKITNLFPEYCEGNNQCRIYHEVDGCVTNTFDDLGLGHCFLTTEFETGGLAHVQMCRQNRCADKIYE